MKITDEKSSEWIQKKAYIVKHVVRGKSLTNINK